MSQASYEPSGALLARPVVPRWRRLLPLFGFLLLAWVLSRLELAAMATALARVPLPVVLWASGLFALNLLIKAVRWQRLLRAQGIELPTRVAVAAFLSGQFYGQITLGRAGEFLRIEALTERGVRAGAALASCVFDRLLDVFIVLLAGVVLGALVLGSREVALLSLTLLLGGFGAGVAVLGGLARMEVDAEHATPARPSWLWRRPLARRLLGHGIELARGTRSMSRPAELAEALLSSALAWMCYFAALWTLAEGLSLGVSRLLLTATGSFAALSALLPITVSGLGARELIYAEVLTGQGVLPEAAVVLSLLHLFVMTSCATLLGMLGVLARQRQRL